MKHKKLMVCVALLALLTAFALAGCGENNANLGGSDLGGACQHTYADATCEAPKTCTKCGVTEGLALGHDMQGATCDVAATCSRCGYMGQALGHSYTAATCTSAATCVKCGATSGGALGHNYKAATCSTPKTCKICGATSGSALGHNYKAATCTSPKTCKTCGATSGSKQEHSWKAATCKAPKTCKNCGATSGSKANHTENSSGMCSVCGKDVLLEKLRANTTGRLIISTVGGMNYACTVEFRNHCGESIYLTALVYANGKGCYLSSASDYELKTGYKCTPTFYRSIIVSERYDDEYEDMYLDNNSMAWTIIKVNGQKIYMKFDVKGNTIFGRTAASIDEY